MMYLVHGLIEFGILDSTLHLVRYMMCLLFSLIEFGILARVFLFIQSDYCSVTNLHRFAVCRRDGGQIRKPDITFEHAQKIVKGLRSVVNP